MDDLRAFVRELKDRLYRYERFCEIERVEWICPKCYRRGLIHDEYERPWEDDQGDVVCTFGLCGYCGTIEILEGQLSEESRMAFLDMHGPRRRSDDDTDCWGADAR